MAGADRGDKARGWLGLASLGFELVAAVAGFTLLGYLVDRAYGTAPWGMVGGAILGLAAGMYNAVRASLAAAREAAERERGDGGRAR